MSEKTEKVLIDWENTERDISNLLHIHFSEYGRWHWCEVSDESRRIYNLMFKTDVEDCSPIDAVLSATAAQAADGVFSAVAAVIGVDPLSLEIVIADWMENQDNPPPAITAEHLVKLCEEESKILYK